MHEHCHEHNHDHCHEHHSPEEALALLAYMLVHNRQHAEELHELAHSVDEAAAAGNFTPEQVSLITGESGGYVVKFKAIELWEEFKKHWR